MAYKTVGSSLPRALRFLSPRGSFVLGSSVLPASQRALSAAAGAGAHEGSPHHYRTQSPTVAELVNGTGLEQNFTDDEAHISGAPYSPPETAADWHGPRAAVTSADAEAVAARNRATQAAAWASSAKSPADSTAASADDPAIAGISAAIPKTGHARMAFSNDAGPLEVSDTAVGSVDFGKVPKGHPASGQQSRPRRGMDPIEEVL